MTNVLYPFI